MFFKERFNKLEEKISELDEKLKKLENKNSELKQMNSGLEERFSELEQVIKEGDIIAYKNMIEQFLGTLKLLTEKYNTAMQSVVAESANSSRYAMKLADEQIAAMSRNIEMIKSHFQHPVPAEIDADNGTIVSCHRVKDE